MSFFTLFRFAALGLIIFMGWVGCIALASGEMSRETKLQHQYGENWKDEYEKTWGSLDEAHTRVAAAAVGIVAIPAMAFWLYRTLRKNISGSGSREKSRRKPQLSNIERITRYRRNAIVGNYFGLAGILAGIALAMFRWRIFADHTNELILGIFVFLAGYCGVISGCWNWVKAKGWPDAVVFIGVMPLAVFFIPFVRLVFIRMPALVVSTMVMMPLILFVVVLVLPDKTGGSRRRTSRSRSKTRDERPQELPDEN